MWSLFEEEQSRVVSCLPPRTKVDQGLGSVATVSVSTELTHSARYSNNKSSAICLRLPSPSLHPSWLLKHDLPVPGRACRVRVQTTVPLPATRQFNPPSASRETLHALHAARDDRRALNKLATKKSLQR